MSRVFLTREDINTLLTSLQFSEQHITDWHARDGKPEWRDASLAPIKSVREKLRTAKAKRPPRAR